MSQKHQVALGRRHAKLEDSSVINRYPFSSTNDCITTAFLAHHDLCICSQPQGGRSNGKQTGKESKKEAHGDAYKYCAPTCKYPWAWSSALLRSIDFKMVSIWRCRFLSAKSVDDRRGEEVGGKVGKNDRTDSDNTYNTHDSCAHTHSGKRRRRQYGARTIARNKDSDHISTTHFTPSNNNALRTRNQTTKRHISKTTAGSIPAIRGYHRTIPKTAVASPHPWNRSLA